MTPADPATTDRTDKHAWERPGAVAVVPGVFRIPLPLPEDGLRAVNVYAVVDGDDVVLVDSGWALEQSEAQLERSLGDIGHDLASISRFLITHVHRDHYTQAITLRRRFGSRVHLGRGEQPNVDCLLQGAEQLPQGLVTRLLIAGADALLAALDRAPATDEVDLSIWGTPDEWLCSGMTISVGPRRLAVIETPGHTRGHVVFHDAEARLLFAGDHVLPHITPSIGFESRPSESPLTDYLDSLRLVGAMADSVLLPAHGPTLPSTRARVDELLAHHDQRLRDTEAAVRAGRETAYDVARALKWTSRHRDFTDLDHFNQLIAVSETLAHLDVLVELDRLTVRTEDRIRYYRT